MKKLIFALFFMLLSAQFVNAETIVIKKTDGSVAVINYLPGSQDSMEEVINDLGYDVSQAELVTLNQLPKDRADREFWKWDKITKKVTVDQDKKQAHLDAVAAKKAKKDAVLVKLKITEDEYKDLTQAGI